MTDVEGCKAKQGQNCTQNSDKCNNCKGNHISQNNAWPRKQEENRLPKEERTHWMVRVTGGMNIPQSCNGGGRVMAAGQGPRPGNQPST
jgi:hypothetical protein